jgi:hypothetical protein
MISGDEKTRRFDLGPWMRTVADCSSAMIFRAAQHNAVNCVNVVGPVGREPTTYGLKDRPRGVRGGPPRHIVAGQSTGAHFGEHG